MSLEAGSGTRATRNSDAPNVRQREAYHPALRRARRGNALFRLALLPGFSSLQGRLRALSACFHSFLQLGSVQDELTHRRPTKDYMSQDRVVRLFRQMVAAVQVMHRSSPPFAHRYAEPGVASINPYRDIKPANFLFDGSDSVLLIDFGSVTQCPIKIDDARQSQIMMDEVAELCSMPYRAPELFTCEIGSTIDQSIDIWVCCTFNGNSFLCFSHWDVFCTHWPTSALHLMKVCKG